MNKSSVISTTVAAITAAMFTFVPGSDACAQDSQAETQMDEVTVTARRREERIQDVPDSITAFSGETLTQAGVDDFVDLSLLTPGVNFQQSFRPGQSYLTVRGIPTAQGGEAPVAIVVDGVQQPSFEWMNPKLLNIKSIEVVKGPQGALYGRGAIAGAIIINTNEPTDETAARLRVGAANGDEYTFDANISGPIAQDNVYFDLVANYRDYGGLVEDHVGRGNDREESFTVQGRLRFFPTENWQVDLSGRHTDIDGGALTVERHGTADVFNLDVRTSAEPPVQQDTKYEQWTVRSITKWDSGELTAIFGVHEVRNERSGDADFSPADALLADQFIDEDTYNAELRWASPSDRAFRWEIGSFWQDRDSRDNLRVFTSPTTVFFPPNFDLLNSTEIENSTAWAVFGQANYDLTEDLELTVALRYDEDERESGDLEVPGSFIENTYKATQPKVSIAYHVTPDFLAYASYGRGFRSGGFNAFADVQNNPSIAREYPKEISNNIELGFKSTLANGRLTFNGALFRIDFDNQQYFFIEVTNIVARSIVSIPETVIEGLELESSWRATDSIDLSLGVSFIDTELKSFPAQPTFEGNRSPFAHDVSVNFSAQHIMPLQSGWEMTSRIDYEHLSDLYFGLENEFLFPSIDILNVRLSFDSDRFGFGLFTKNSLDEQTTGVFFPNAFNPGDHGRTRILPRQYGAFVDFRF